MLPFLWAFVLIPADSSSRPRSSGPAEKALMDKSPLKTLTLEEFLESERHKLTGPSTPVTPESFAKWKQERMDKKAAEEQARKAREATGRALFESGNWRRDEDDSEEDEDVSSGEETEDAWNLEKLRKETEALRQQKEDERVAALYAGDAGSSSQPAVAAAAAAAVEATPDT